MLCEMSVSLYLRQQGPPVSRLHPDEDDGTGVCFLQLRPVRAGESSSLWRRTEQGVGPGYKPLNKPRAFGRQVHQRDSNIPQLLSVGPHTLNNTLTAQANHLAIFQVNVKHQLVWWSDSQKPTGGLNLITLERGPTRSWQGPQVWEERSPSPQNERTPVLGALQDPKH